MQCLTQNDQQAFAIIIVQHDGLTPATSRSHVVDGTWKLDSKWSCRFQDSRKLTAQLGDGVEHPWLGGKRQDLTPPRMYTMQCVSNSFISQYFSSLPSYLFFIKSSKFPRLINLDSKSFALTKREKFSLTLFASDMDRFLLILIFANDLKKYADSLK